MPWRAIESAPADAGAATTSRGAEAPTLRVSRTTLAVLGAAALVAFAAFVLAFGSGASGAIEVVGGGTIDQPSASAAGDGVRSLASDAGVSMLVVEIVGAVERPGVYRLPDGSRVGDLVDAAGGYGPRVDTGRASEALNLAARLADGDQVRVPSRDDASADPASTHTAGEPNGAGSRVDLNRATADELDTLPGVGPATAAKIIAAREEAPFTSVDDLQTRRLVGAKTFEKLRDLVAVR
jgi:competence protein ComEA